MATDGSDWQSKHSKAHKFMLVSRSCVFYAMLAGPLAEQQREVELPDVEPEAFERLLQFVYCEQTSVDGDNVLSVLYCAKKYLIRGLIEKCLAFLKGAMSTTNMCIIMENAHVFADQELRTQCLTKIVLEPLPVLNDESVTELCSDCYSDIIKSNSLPLKENIVFDCLFRYAQLKCQRLGLEETPENMRKEAGNALLHVRFPIMSSEYFSERVEPTGLLSEDQTMQLYRFFARKKTGDAGGFETKERMPMFVARRFKHVTSGWSYSGQREKVDAITFMCSRDIILKGVQLYGTDQGQGQLSVNIRLVQEPYRANMLNLHKVLETDGKEQVYSVLFEHPKTIKKDKQYSFEITIEGQNTFYGVEGQPVVESETVQFTFSDSAKSTNTTNTYRGQIPGIIFDMNKDQS
ncbi:BTB/POZ domain-containing protein 6-like isoform X2 [Dreissena polymorpha]|uniref:BTB/POZ domain-containing protein 6-like isoform X2 n=1 Tax=Dreissena polymorpha TaxID=45954 RepID=UPI00226410CE|nr:BTB/POZ domain-containing protein 6-like isoform X2 [Dreissena polymorpha]XP_052234943.1 BTB/POZ domain-containing protein 6-like isoform X2 [Dreissena polymorpha]